MTILKDETVKNAHRYLVNTTDFFRSSEILGLKPRRSRLALR
ncbi:hypothetical protein N0824_01464 [Microcystis sp. 0824]|nr:hypothetical protein N0824_01464 [Microcystis sp. 0824]